MDSKAIASKTRTRPGQTDNATRRIEKEEKEERKGLADVAKGLRLVKQ